MGASEFDRFLAFGGRSDDQQIRVVRELAAKQALQRLLILDNEDGNPSRFSSQWHPFRPSVISRSRGGSQRGPAIESANAMAAKFALFLGEIVLAD
jgi:hypothetical protein